MTQFLDYVKHLGHSVGVELTRYRPYEARRTEQIRRLDIQTVIDVGANRGQTGLSLREFGFGGRIISLEPLAAPFALLEGAAARDDKWTAIRGAAATAAGTASINVSRNLASSSFLSITSSSTDSAPETATEGSETVDLMRLDELEEIRVAAAPLMLKLDVQGFELEALKGATGILDGVRLIEAEVSIVELYDGQPLIADVLDHTRSIGFDLIALDPGFIDRRDGANLQFNATFGRKQTG